MVADDFDVELKEAADQAAGSSGAAPDDAHAMSARKPGVVSRAKERLSDKVARLGRPQLTVKNTLWGLLLVVVVAMLAENWSQVRLNFFGAYVDVPKPVAFVVDVGIGALVMWLIMRRKDGAVEGGEVAE